MLAKLSHYMVHLLVWMCLSVCVCHISMADTECKIGLLFHERCDTLRSHGKNPSPSPSIFTYSKQS